MTEEQIKEFWNQTLETSKWNDLPRDIKNELADFYEFMDKMGSLIENSSGGKLSKLNYTKDVYITAFEDHLNEIVDDEVKEALASQLQEIEKMIEEWGKMLKGGSNEWLVDDLLSELNNL